MRNVEGNAALLGRLAKTGAALAAQGRTVAKFPLIKTALAEVCQGLPPDTRLPSIRELAVALRSTVVPVQRAVNELKKEGLLRAKHKSGLYSPGKTPEPSASPAGMAGFKRSIRFLTDSALPEQRALWDGIARDFHDAQDYIAVDIDYRTLGDGPMAVPMPDVLECNGWGFHRHFRELGLLRLQDFLDGAGTAFVGDSLATIYHQSAYLYYNVTALGHAAPSHADLAEQTRICRELKAASAIQPILLSGGFVGELAATLRAGRNPEDADLPARFHQLVELATSFSYRVGDQTVDKGELFVAGAVPLFLGNSNYLGEFRRDGLPFDWKAAPALNVESGLVKNPIVAAIRERTDSPMECVRWIKHLLSERAQERFADFGYVTTARPPDPRFADSEPMFAADYAEHYIGVYIVNAELWSCIKGEQSAAAAWRNVVTYAKAYLAG